MRNYDFPPGVEALRRQIARRSLTIRCEVAPQDVVVTAGALEAINLSLRAVAKPGDVIAVESPLYFGILGSVASLNMKTIEIPTHPQQGMDLGHLERAIRKHKIKACITMTNCHNPLGFVLPDRHKRDLVDLTGRLNVAVIEDDLYGDLAYESPRPLTAKSFDRKGLVLLCSSVLQNLVARISRRLGSGRAVPRRGGAAEAGNQHGRPVLAAVGGGGVSGVGQLRPPREEVARDARLSDGKRASGDRPLFSGRNAHQPACGRLHVMD